MQFFGIIAFDGGTGGRLESRTTKSAEFMVISDWVNSVVEHYQGELNYNVDCEWHEIRVMVYVNEPKSFTVEAEPIMTKVLRKTYTN